MGVVTEEGELDPVLVIIIDPALKAAQPDGPRAVADHGGDAVFRETFSVIFDMGQGSDA